MTDQTSGGTIELRLRDGGQLFNTLDPFPFSEGDIAPDAERYIVDWAKDLPKDAPIAIVIHIEQPAPAGKPSLDLPAALKGWFAARARDESRALSELFRDGRLAFLIGFIGLGTCMSLSFLLSRRFDGPFAITFRESLVIIGWVVIWRPAEMFLYDWLPLSRRRRLYRRLAEAQVTVKPAPRGQTCPRGADQTN